MKIRKGSIVDLLLLPSGNFYYNIMILKILKNRITGKMGNNGLRCDFQRKDIHKVVTY